MKIIEALRQLTNAPTDAGIRRLLHHEVIYLWRDGDLLHPAAWADDLTAEAQEGDKFILTTSKVEREFTVE